MLPPLPSACRRAFTLLELLVSMAVLVLLVAMVSGIVASATKITTNSRKYLDADRQARLVFDRLASDLGSMVKRHDADALFFKNGATTGGPGTNDAMYFFSDAPGYYKSSDPTNKGPLSLVGYRVNTKFQLERLSKGLAWDTAGGSGQPMPFLSFLKPGSGLPVPDSTIAGHWPQAVGTPPGSNGGADPDFHVLADAVYRLEICFEVRNPSDYTNPPVTSFSNLPVACLTSTAINQCFLQATPPASPRVRDRWWDTVNSRAYLCAAAANATGGAPAWNPLGLDDVQAIIVTLGILDPKSAAPVLAQGTLAPDTGDKLVKYFVDPAEKDLVVATPPTTATPVLPSQSWIAALPGLAKGVGIPPAVASQVRVYQRLFNLNNLNNP